MDWKILAIITPFTFVIFQTISKTLPKGAPTFLINAYASLVGVLFMLLLWLLTSNKKSVALSGKYLSIAAAMGILISLGNYGIIKAYSSGAPQSIFTPVFYVLLICYGIIFGFIFWHEHLNAPQVCGVLIALVGIFITIYFRK
jgi:drug/metabolite transporter (DMT)-like permease